MCGTNIATILRWEECSRHERQRRAIIWRRARETHGRRVAEGARMLGDTKDAGRQGGGDGAGCGGRRSLADAVALIVIIKGGTGWLSGRRTVADCLRHSSGAWMIGGRIWLSSDRQRKERCRDSRGRSFPCTQRRLFG